MSVAPHKQSFCFFQESIAQGSLLGFWAASLRSLPSFLPTSLPLTFLVFEGERRHPHPTPTACVPLKSSCIHDP